MKIEGVQNQFVDLELVNYQFPESNDKMEDGNWLNIKLTVNSLQGNWQVVDPCLLTWEIQEIADWLTTLSQNRAPRYFALDFLEPNLSFHLMNFPSDSVKKIKLEFQLECRPKNPNDAIEYFVIFEANREKLIELSKSLIEDLAKFPVRK